MSFVGELQYERVGNKESFVGRPVYRLTRQFAYMTTINGKADAVVCEEGFETDFASIPEWIFFLRPRNGKWAKSSVIHDKACILASKKEMSYKQADHIFYNAMLEDDASKFTAWFLWILVRINHIVVGKK